MKHPIPRQHIAVAAAGLLLIGLTQLPPPANALPQHRDAPTEVVLSDIDGVTESLVTYWNPLPAGVAPHSPRCDQNRFIRYRMNDAPPDPADVDAVFAAQPGATAAAASQAAVARSTLRQLADQGRTAQWWTFERRENCVHDTTGLDAAEATRDYRTAIDYYFNGATVNGRRFAGWTNPDIAVLTDIGIAQVVGDMQFIVSNELPSAADRRQKLYVGGHSAGGPIVSCYLGWEFEGDPDTTGGAAKDQVAGAFALDSVVTADYAFLADDPLVRQVMSAVGSASRPAAVHMMRAGIIPDHAGLPDLLGLPNALGLDELGFPQVAEVANIVGLAARFEPDAPTELARRMPRTWYTELVLRLLFSENYRNALTGNPNPWDIRATNAAVLGFALDDNTSPLFAIQASFGGLSGGPVVEKNFPIPTVLNQIPLLKIGTGAVGGKALKVTASSTTADYRWTDYDGLGANPAVLADGRMFSAPDQEVTAATDMARQVGAAGKFIGSYENLRKYLDFGFLAAGDRSGELARLRYPHWKTLDRLPTATILGEKSLGDGAGIPIVADRATTVVAAGYSHLDTVMANYRTNSGRPEVVGATLTDLAMHPDKYRR
ncbi:hypothetical protein ACWIGW_21185 [Nocardia brasiliensis]